MMRKTLNKINIDSRAQRRICILHDCGRNKNHKCIMGIGSKRKLSVFHAPLHLLFSAARESEIERERVIWKTGVNKEKKHIFIFHLQHTMCNTFCMDLDQKIIATAAAAATKPKRKCSESGSQKRSCIAFSIFHLCGFEQTHQSVYANLYEMWNKQMCELLLLNVPQWNSNNVVEFFIFAKINFYLVVRLMLYLYLRRIFRPAHNCRNRQKIFSTEDAMTCRRSQQMMNKCFHMSLRVSFVFIWSWFGKCCLFGSGVMCVCVCVWPKWKYPTALLFSYVEYVPSDKINVLNVLRAFLVVILSESVIRRTV